MGRKPFNVSTPAAPAAPTPPPTTKWGEAQEKAEEDGTNLLEAGAEVMTPDGEVGPLQEAAGGPGERPVYKPAIPWPAADNGKKPYKI